ncbi:MAG TPA: hypothetical protein VFU97_24425 [Xanthobacteraceae bacterium]|nr:hypothetical protein [Xanthobacteraceae bacterium]
MADIQKDSSDNIYINVGNVRLTYVRAERRSPEKNWSGKDVVRIQAYRNDHDGPLHTGAEFPVGGEGGPYDAMRFLEAFSALCIAGRGDG